MKKIISYLIILFLTSCTSVGKFGAGVDITFDPRTIGMQIDDTIMQKNLSARLALANKKYFVSIQSEVLDGRIFLSGKVYDDLKNHSWLSAKAVGQFQFKGMEDYIQIYAVDCENITFPTDPELSHFLT